MAITLVQKFGGTSVASPERFLGVARRILEEKRRGRRMIVVVSAMGQSTDELVELARQVSAHPPRREMDMLLTAGERISMALLAMALESVGVPAISFTGSQSGIITDDRHSDARIAEIRAFRIEEALEQDRVVIVAGFQGVSHRKEVTTLGRGGSDTTAVALAIRFGCPWCEIFTDVHGILTADPRIVPAARTIPEIGAEATIVLSHLGAQVLFRRSVLLARKFQMPLRVRCSLSDGAETWIGARPRFEPEEAAMTVDSKSPESSASKPIDVPMETERILSVALEPHCTGIEIIGKEKAQRLLAILDEGPTAPPWTWVEVNQDGDSMRVRAVRADPGPNEAAMRERSRGTSAVIRCCSGLAAVSLVGEGILARPDLLAEAVGALDDAGIEVRSSRTASMAVSFLIEGAHAEKAARLLHARFVEGGREA